ncbi:MAG: DUF2306 domain-containing protein [Bacteroidota bacterium]
MSSWWNHWRLAAGLIGLSLIPAIAGTGRVIQILSHVPITAENARFMSAPVPGVLHIFAVTIYCILGALQFVPYFRSRHIRWHRFAGRLLVLCGLTASLSGLWMTQFYEWPEYDGFGLYVVRLIVGTAMTVSLILGFSAIRRGDKINHRKWMMRGYALGLGAGTQVFTHIPWIVLSQYHNETFRLVSMTAGWCINVLVIEWLLYRQSRVREKIISV